jgi:hypothetical protein
MENNNKIYYITLQEIFDEDWQTQLAQGYPNIPKNEKVLYIKTFQNCYGTYIRVKWNNILYDTVPWKLKRIKEN